MTPEVPTEPQLKLRLEVHPDVRARIVSCLALVLAALALVPGRAMASHDQVAILQDDMQLFEAPATTMQELRHLGVEMVRVYVRWSLFAPAPNSHRRPPFNASDPNAYPPRSWVGLDAIVRDAAARGIQVMLVPTGFAPLWAQGPKRFCWTT